MSAGAPTPETPDIRIVAGNPSAEEVAAVSAVLTAALDELAGQHRRADSGPTGWQRSQRTLRAPLAPGTWSTPRM